jgi:uncharacterized protein (DUF302 family)
MESFIPLALIGACLLALVLIFLSIRRIQKEGFSIRSTDRQHFVRSVEDVKRQQELEQEILHMADDASRGRVITSRLGFGKTVQMSVEDAMNRVKEALHARGFQFMNAIDAVALLGDKQLPAYRLLTVYHRQWAARAIGVEPLLGLMTALAIVRQDLAGDVHIEFSDPSLAANQSGEAELHKMAAEFKAMLLKVLQAI